MKNIHIRKFPIFFSEEDKMKIAFKTSKGEVISFKIQYMTMVGQEWRTVVRYDTFHWHAHRHTFYLSKKKSVRRVPIAGDYGRVLTQSLEDIKNNWKKIKENFLIQ